jgi:ferredoxin
VVKLDSAESHARPGAPPLVTEALSERAEVCFTPGPTVLAKLGESLLRVAEANQVPLRSGCRMGLCGADPVQIVAGGENLSPPSAAERMTLQRRGLPPDCRMACSARVRGPVTVAPRSAEQARPLPAAPEAAA